MTVHFKMEEPSLEVVLKALDALFRKDDNQDKEQASLWLTQLQGSVGHRHIPN